MRIVDDNKMVKLNQFLNLIPCRAIEIAMDISLKEVVNDLKEIGIFCSRSAKRPSETH